MMEQKGLRIWIGVAVGVVLILILLLSIKTGDGVLNMPDILTKAELPSETENIDDSTDTSPASSVNSEVPIKSTPTGSSQKVTLVKDLAEEFAFFITKNDTTGRTATLYHGDTYQTPLGIVSLQRLVLEDKVTGERVIFETTATDLQKSGFCMISEDVLYKLVEFSPGGKYLIYEKTCGGIRTPYAYDVAAKEEVALGLRAVATYHDAAKGDVRLLYWDSNESRLMLLLEGLSVVYVSGDGDPRNLRSVFDVSNNEKWSTTISNFRFDAAYDLLTFDVTYLVKQSYLNTLDRPDLVNPTKVVSHYTYDVAKDDWFKNPGIPE